MYINQSKQASHMHFHSNKRQMYGSKSKQAFSYYHTFVSFDMAYKTRQDKTRQDKNQPPDRQKTIIVNVELIFKLNRSSHQ